MEHSPLKNSLAVGFLALATLQISVLSQAALIRFGKLWGWFYLQNELLLCLLIWRKNKTRVLFKTMIIKKINKFVLLGKLDQFFVTLLSEYLDLTNGWRKQWKFARFYCIAMQMSNMFFQLMTAFLRQTLKNNQLLCR